MEFTRFTIFHVFRILGLMAGAWIGMHLGLFWFGKIGGVVGGILGAIVGAFLGHLPERWASKSIMKEITEGSNEKLKTLIAKPDWNFWHTMALLELVVRNENVESEFPRILEMLEADSVSTRIFGWDAMRIVFTERAKLIEDYDPKHPTEVCRKKASELRNRNS